jgi:hypothetical protein
MPKAIRTDSVNNRTTGIALPALRSGVPASVAQQVHDGDTLSVRPDGDVGVRLLGIDTPEVSFAFPGPTLRFVSLGDESWNRFLKDPFSEQWGKYETPLSEEMKSWIAGKINGSPGTVHNEHADRATVELRDMISKDMEIMGQDISRFSYFLRFGFEVMDGYGRFLCTINRNQPDRNVPGPRPATYNMRMLERGLAFPYFIWPNVNPTDRPGSIAAAVIPPGKAKQLAETDLELKMARGFVKQARAAHLGLYNAMEPCLIEPFELRFLSRRSLPSRYVMDLTSDSNRLIPPERYFEVPLSEDRLWIPDIYVPLFEKSGWVV